MTIWPFCEKFYGRKPVATLCLHLQDRYQLNVGLIIWLCWHSAHNRFVSGPIFQQASLLSDFIYDPLILPLRAIRKQVLHASLTDDQIIYQHVLTAEILMEKSLLLMLDDRLTPQVAAELDGQTFGLLDYLSQSNVENAEQSVRFLYASALSCVSE